MTESVSEHHQNIGEQGAHVLMSIPFAQHRSVLGQTKLTWALIVTMNTKKQKRRAHTGMPILLD